jgi:hypothetical protein
MNHDTNLPQNPSLRELADRLGGRSRRRIPLLVVGLMAVVVGLAILTFQLDVQRKKAETAALLAEADAARAKRAMYAAEQARRQTELAHNANARILGEAKEALRLGQRERLANLLQVGLIDAERDAQLVRGGIGSANLAVPSAEGTRAARTFDLPSPSRSYRQKVFIQFAGLIQRPDIAALNRALSEAGWNLQGRDGERTGSAAGLHEVRYSAEDDREAAIELARVLTTARVASDEVTARRVPIIGPGTLEVWISNS